LVRSTVPKTPPAIGAFAVFLPTLQDFQSFSSLVCLLKKHGHQVKTLIFGEFDDFGGTSLWKDQVFVVDDCNLEYSTISGLLSSNNRSRHLVMLDWLEILDRQPDIVIGLIEEDMPAGPMHMWGLPNTSILVRIPRADLLYCGWMSSLSMAEWRSSDRLSWC
jgi:hypothetical protein